MNKFDWQVLEAIYWARPNYKPSDKTDLRAGEVTDVTVWRSGQILFGSEWGGGCKYMKANSLLYVPTVALSLGRLVRAGLVEKRPSPGEWSRWLLTESGYLTALELTNDQA